MKLTLLLIPLLFLSSCTIDWNDEKDKKIIELEKQIQDNTFKKRQDCTGMIGKKIMEINRTPEIKIDEIFYSPVTNDCMLIVSAYNDLFKGISKGLYLGGGVPKFGSLGFIDTYHMKSCNLSQGKTCDAFDFEINFYKGE